MCLVHVQNWGKGYVGGKEAAGRSDLEAMTHVGCYPLLLLLPCAFLSSDVQV